MSKDKMIVSLPYGDGLVLDTEDAIALLKILARAEKWQEKYHTAQQPTEENGHKARESFSSYHCYGFERSGGCGSAKVLNNTLYQTAKMAGKPGGE